ncbi:hypothetical protein [Micromonospora pattaloongensis]|uniref:hypothetical protein n=1 Tax=Micromonospora pattaloongensis TaxID=405436 RepID=UPI0011150A23|nr:hypothetical protein [Micromonospora pattaloongensis]
MPGSAPSRRVPAYDEWRATRVDVVSYGCVSICPLAVDRLRTAVTTLHTVTVRDSVGVELLGQLC